MPHHALNGEGWVVLAAHLLFWLVIALGLFYFLSRHGHRYFPSHRPDDALEIAKTRYAKGEINKDEFDRLKRDLA